MLLKLIFIHPSDTLDNTRRTKTYNQLTKFHHFIDFVIIKKNNNNVTVTKFKKL